VTYTVSLIRSTEAWRFRDTSLFEFTIGLPCLSIIGLLPMPAVQSAAAHRTVQAAVPLHHSARREVVPRMLEEF
jgi:hypothetical protein